LTNKVKINSFNDEGISKFNEFLKQTREWEIQNHEILDPDKNWLFDQTQIKHSLDIEIDLDSNFDDRYHFAEYLGNCFGDSFKDELYSDHGLWTWLALAYFNQLRNKKFRKHGDTEYATNESHHYIPHNWFQIPGHNYWYRHSVQIPFRLVKRFGENAKFFVSKNTNGGMAAMGDCIEQTVSRPIIFSSSKTLATLFELYQEKDGYLKKGALSYTSFERAQEGNTSGYGKIRRLYGDAIPRIKLTHDFDSMEVDQVIDICGEEFLSQLE
jgi:hypothetical protein